MRLRSKAVCHVMQIPEPGPRAYLEALRSGTGFKSTFNYMTELRYTLNHQTHFV